MLLLKDDATGSLWDHITGEAIYGPLAGKRLESWGIEMTNVRAALKREPGLLIHVSHATRPVVGLYRKFRRAVFGLLRRLGLFTPFMHRNLGDVDDRRPAVELGLGVVTEAGERFYPLATLKTPREDTLGGGPLRIGIGEEDQIPFAQWADGSRPLQLFTRWYAFAASFPKCTVFSPN
jgi:hypothetical protein